VTLTTRAIRRATTLRLNAAVHQSAPLSKRGLLERLFTFAFQHLVYPQIWEDPVVDMAALDVGPNDHVVTIASGGCNVLSYLTADPGAITAIDLNGAHVALTRLKLCGLSRLPDYPTFFEFFGQSDKAANVDAYHRYIRPHLDDLSRNYWDGRRLGGRPRIAAFTENFYRQGLLGWFIGTSHSVAKLYGRDPEAILRAKNLGEQAELFQNHLAPMLDEPIIRWLVRQPATLYGLGIPPSQYRALAGDQVDGIAGVLKQRLERLACGFDIKSNYFAWQAFGRRYPSTEGAALPPYLQAENFDALRRRADRVVVRHTSMTRYLAESPPRSVDCFVLLDAQDWMTDADLTALWTEIARTARPGARIIFRTAANERLLPGRIPQHILDSFTYDPDLCRDFCRRDRSSIYGGFHLYRKDHHDKGPETALLQASPTRHRPGAESDA
jgi:S-adenosylmethionine-diacylglycerol 3-amino-3-carboxypropyl transferase